MAKIERTYYRLIFPENLEHTAVDAFVNNIGGLSEGGTGLVFEVWADRAGIHHRIGLPNEAVHLIEQLRTHTHGLNIEEEKGLPLADFSYASEYGLTSDEIPLDIQDPYQVAASILTSLQPLKPNEVSVIQWVINPTNRQRPQLRQAMTMSLGHVRGRKDLFTSVAAGIFNAGSAITNQVSSTISQGVENNERERQFFIQQKWQGHMFNAICRIGIRSPNGNVKLLHDRIINTMQATSANVQFSLKRYGNGKQIIGSLQHAVVPNSNWPCLLNSKELSALLAFPIGSPAVPGLHLGGSYQAPPPPNIPIEGRMLAFSTYNSEKRPLAIPWEETLRHFYTVGSTGSGKTTLLENCAIQDVKHGAGLIYIDPKGDSAQRLINCIPKSREQDVIYFNPTDRYDVVGLNLFSGSTENPSLTTDNIVGMFKKLYKDSWGPRLEHNLRGAVRTLAEVPYMTLLEVSELLTSEKFRNQMLQQIKMSPTLQDFWKNYNSMSAAERSQTLAPILNKLHAFGLRDEIRHVIGQSIGINMQEIITGRKIVIVTLPKGELGEDTTSLLGSILMLQLWQAVQRRPQNQRKIPFYCYVDECQDFLNLPTPLGDILAQARGYGFGLTLANQHLEQLEKEMRQDILANSNSFAFFRLSAHDAGIIAKQYSSSLEPKDFMNLGQYEIITSISTGGYMRPKPTVGTTYSQAKTTGSDQAVREHTKIKYAYPCYKVDEDIIRRREAYSKRPNVGSRPVD